MTFEELQKRNKILERRWKICLAVLALFIVTRPVAVYIASKFFDCNASYAYVNNSLVCEPAVIKKTGYASTQDKIVKYIEQEKSAGRLSEASIYFRDLKNGPVFGINESSDFAPASLLKLPLALVYLSEAERNPEILLQKLIASELPNDVGQFYRPQEIIEANREYTVEELLERMLKYSDNNATLLLNEHLVKTGHENLMKETFLNLGIIAPADIYDEAITVRRYASIYRALYNISFLNAEYSEKVLSWMSERTFGKGIERNIPENIKVANKFGERFSPDGSKQLHDCGIVYYPENPYLICVMTRGAEFDPLIEVLSHISEMVYEEVDSRRLD